MKSMMRKTTRREIKNSLGRYIAILSIIALGVGFFAGLRVTKSAMIKTGDEYFKEQNLFDYRLLTTVGFNQDDVAEIQAPFIKKAVGAFSTDFLGVDAAGSEYVYKLMSITEGMNDFVLLEGRMPENKMNVLLIVD